MDANQLDAAAESTAAKLLARFVTPLLIVMIGFLGGTQLKDIKDSQAENKSRSDRRDEVIATIQSDVRVINTRLDIQVLNRLVDLESKVNRLEQAQGVK